MEELKRLIKTTGIYFLGTVGTKLISFLLLPLYTAYLLPSEYGRYDVNITYANLFTAVCFMYIWTGIMKFIFESKQIRQKLEIIYSGILIFLFSALLYVMAMSLFGYVWRIEYIVGVAAYGFFMCLQELYGYLARAYGKNLLFIFTGIVSTTCNATLNILLLVVFKWDYKALYVSYCAGILLQCMILESKLQLIRKFNRTYLTKDAITCLLRFSLPLCINALCYWMLTGYNRIMIEREMDTTANGYYAVASKFGGILILVSTCFTMAWQELAYSKYERDKSTGEFYSYATNVYIKALFCGFFVILPIVYMIFPYLVDDGYEAAKPLVPISMLATLAGVLFTFLENIISTYKKNNIIFISTLVASIINMIVLHALIGKLGAGAANLALLAGYVVSDGIRIYIIGRIIEYHLNWKIFLYLLPLTGIALLTFWRGKKADNVILIFISFFTSIRILWIDIEPIIRKVVDKMSSFHFLKKER